jgi:hypothetical protein
MGIINWNNRRVLLKFTGALVINLYLGYPALSDARKTKRARVMQYIAKDYSWIIRMGG